MSVTGGYLYYRLRGLKRLDTPLPVEAMKTGSSLHQPPHQMDMATFTRRLHYPRTRSPLKPLNRRLGGSTTGIDVFEHRKISFPCRGSKPVSSLYRPNYSDCPIQPGHSFQHAFHLERKFPTQQQWKTRHWLPTWIALSQQQLPLMWPILISRRLCFILSSFSVRPSLKLWATISQATYIEARSCKYCCTGKARSVTYFVCVFVALRVQHAMCMRNIVICGLSGSTIFFHIIS